MISLVIPVYIFEQSQIDVTQRCLESLESVMPDELILIDNGSTIPVKFPYTYRLEENRGYSGGVNAGLRAATGDILVVGSNDLVFSDDWIEDTKKAFKNHEALIYRQSDDLNNAKFKAIWAISRDLYVKTGHLDEQFFTAFADTDYWRRVKNEGVDIPLSKTIIGHDKSHTVSRDTKSREAYGEAVKLYKNKWGSLD